MCSTARTDAAQERRYLREVERHFLKRRGSPLLISPRDWALVICWFEEGIPLPVVISGIDEVFDRREAEGKGHRIRSLSFCRPAVEDLWEERRGRLAAVSSGGCSTGAGGPLPEEGRELRLSRVLEEAAARTRGAIPALEAGAARRLEEAADMLESASRHLLDGRAGGADPADSRAIRRRARRADRGLEWIDTLILRADREIGSALVDGSPFEQVEEARREAQARLAPHRRHMSPSIYEQTLARAVENRLRDRHGLSRLSLLLLD